MLTFKRIAVVVLVLAASGCTAGPPSATPKQIIETEPAASPTGSAKKSRGGRDARDPFTLNKWVTRPPAWLGKRVLPLGPNGMGVAKPTPPILRNRRFPTVDILPRPKHEGYKATISPVPRDVLERSTWRSKCPVEPSELTYLTMTFWGFDHLRHTGEMIVHASVAEDIARVFEQIYDARFAIEDMRVTTLEEQRAWDRAPTGDTNVTSSFECREATGGTSWSEHAYGLAVDINPFHNPYLLGDIVGPELAGAYTDRDWKRPGMIFEGDPVVSAFDSIGWEWGGRWNSLKDWMHFSRSGH